MTCTQLTPCLWSGNPAYGLAGVSSSPLRLAARYMSQGGCKKCRRVWLLLQYHAKSCKNKDCLVPKCPQIREALR